MRLVFTLALLVAAIRGEACGQAIIGDMFASDASVRGSVLFSSAGTQIQSGSSVSAGDATAVLKLKRGGEVRICPRTTVSVASSPNGRDLLWGMNTGSIESHFTLNATADTVMTPDFRIMLAGPGEFHFAISADSQGNACVRALPSNTASLIVSEINGDGTYQVQPNAQVLFRNGTVANPSPFVPPACGCPATIPVQRAEAPPAPPKPVPPPEEKAEADPKIEFYPQPPLPNGLADLAPTSALPPHSDVHMQMESPLVYSPADPDLEMVMAVSRLRLTTGLSFDRPIVLPPSEPSQGPRPPAMASAIQPAQNKPKKGFFGKLGSFFSAIFK